MCPLHGLPALAVNGPRWRGQRAGVAESLTVSGKDVRQQCGDGAGVRQGGGSGPLIDPEVGGQRGESVVSGGEGAGRQGVRVQRRPAGHKNGQRP